MDSITTRCSTPVPQPDRHRQQLLRWWWRSPAISCIRRRAAAGAAPAHTPPAGLTQIQRRHPLHHQFGIVDLFHSRYPSHATEHNRRPPAGTEREEQMSRTLVLMATMRSSTNDSQDQTISRAHLRQEHSTSASDRPRFSRIHGVPAGAPQLFRDRVQFCSGLVDLVVRIGRHGGGGHLLALRASDS